MHAAAPARADGSASGSSPSRRTPDMDALYSRLAEADETEDAKALATLAWELYGLLGLDEADLNAHRARLQQLLPPLHGTMALNPCSPGSRLAAGTRRRRARAGPPPMPPVT
jgi:hypothetical protein